jgi:endonuclease/exonuclease/phosphatase family metal-dependent hydrolase
VPNSGSELARLPYRQSWDRDFLAYLKQLEQTKPVLVCGDFNDTPMSYTYNQFQNKLTDGFREASWGLGSTYNGRIPAGRIDYIFRSEGIECSDFKIFQNNFSDHKPIRCRIVITPNQ